MTRILFLLLATSVMIQKGYTQDKFSVIREILSNENKPVVFHYKFNADTLGDFSTPDMHYKPKHHYLWHKKGLKVQPDGTGKILQLQESGKIYRIDSTVYHGYNFGAFNFVFKDTLFSFGGYGFWHFNGMLRYFNEKIKSWSVIPTNKSVPFRMWFNGQVFLDYQANKLFVLFKYPSEGLAGETPKDENEIHVECLNLISKQWELSGFKVNEDVMSDWDWASKPMFNADLGLITFNKDELHVYDFNQNRFGKIKPEKALALIDSWYMNDQLLQFAKGNHFYHFNPMNAKIDSFTIRMEDIQWQDKKLMKEDTSAFYLRFGLKPLILIGLLVCFGCGYLIGKNRLKYLKHDTMVADGYLDPGVIQSTIEEPKKTFRDTLTETEKSVIDLLIRNTLSGKMTSVHLVNEALGIAKKDIKLQNNVRSACFQMINQKFKVYSGLSDDIIIKERTSFDKRFFEYQILGKYIQKVKN